MKVKKKKTQKEEKPEIGKKIEEEQIIKEEQVIKEKPEIKKKEYFKNSKEDVPIKQVSNRDVSTVQVLNKDIPINQISSEQENIQYKYYYVYGIINNEEIKLDIKGLKDNPIQKLDLKDMAALFSFYPNLHPIVEEKEAMLHAEILNKLADKTTIIPMAFGTVFKDQEILETVLAKSYKIAKKTLELVKDKSELGIKVVKKESEVIPEEVSKDILGELNKLSVKSVQGNKFSERLLLNHSFLVEKNKFAQFSNKIGEMEEKYQNLKFLYTGPWPAYSFVNINIKAS